MLNRQHHDEAGHEALSKGRPGFFVVAHLRAVHLGDPVEISVLVQQHPVAILRANPIVHVFDDLCGQLRAFDSFISGRGMSG